MADAVIEAIAAPAISPMHRKSPLRSSGAEGRVPRTEEVGMADAMIEAGGLIHRSPT
jgi:hypothetical protein